MSRHRKELREALGPGLFGLCVNPSLTVSSFAPRAFSVALIQLRTQKIFMEGGFIQWHSKQYVKTINLFCAGNKVFVIFKLKEGF